MDNKRVLVVDGGGPASAAAALVRNPGTVTVAVGEPRPDWKARSEEIDRQWVQRIQTRMRKAAQRKDKDIKGCLCTEYKGSVRVKLTKQYGGKRARRILNAERRTAREYPGELRLFEIANVPIGRDKETNDIITEKHERELARGVDFALVIDGGDISLVIDDSVKEFRAESALNDGALAGMLGT